MKRNTGREFGSLGDIVKFAKEHPKETALVVLAIVMVLAGCQPSTVDVMNAEANKSIAESQAILADEAQTRMAPTKTPDFNATGVTQATRAVQKPTVEVEKATLTPMAVSGNGENSANQANGGVSADGIPDFSTAVKLGQDKIINWGYGSFGDEGLIYPKISPDGQIPMGPSQLVTDFDGRNWQPEGRWCWTTPVGATTLHVVVQGDAPGKVDWAAGTSRFCLTTNADVSAQASDAVDNAPHPRGNGSSGISVVAYTQ